MAGHSGAPLKVGSSKGAAARLVDRPADPPRVAGVAVRSGAH